MKHIDEKKNRFPIFRERLNNLLGDMSTTAFAQKAGISRQTMGFYLNGERIPDAETLAMICRNLNVKSDWLLGLTNDPDPQPCAVDDLGLSVGSINAIMRLSTIERNGLESFLCSDMLPQVCGSISAYVDIPKQYKLHHGQNPINQYRKAGNAEEFIEKAIIEMYPEMEGKFTVSCGINYTDHVRRQVIIALENMLYEFDWEKKDGTATFPDG